MEHLIGLLGGEMSQEGARPLDHQNAERATAGCAFQDCQDITQTHSPAGSLQKSLENGIVAAIVSRSHRQATIFTRHEMFTGNQEMAMRIGAIVDDLPAFTQALIERYGIDEIAQFTKIDRKSLEVWQHGGNHYSPQVEWLLFGFCVNKRAFDLLKTFSSVIPTFDVSGRNSGERIDFTAPPLGSDREPPQVDLVNRPATIANLSVNFPFGISASILTRNSHAIAFYAARGFDILTYKTVRSVKRDAHPAPNWVFIHSKSATKMAPPFDEPVVGELNYWPQSPYEASTANSFGIPSEEPAFWQPDIECAKGSLRPGQILIVSVTASTSSNDRSEKTLVDDFVRVALLAKEAGADIIEANFSCPNTPGDPTGELYRDPELSGRVAAALRRALKNTPLFAKIGYLSERELVSFVQHTRSSVQGIVAINTLSMPVMTPAGEQLFPNTGQSNRFRGGVSGPIIRPWAKEVVRNLVEIRAADKADYAIIAVGGVSTAEDVYNYLNLGADAVESCTAAYLNPNLALETRLQRERLSS